ncbi:LolA-like protein [Gimesia algae]|uniref:Uncharacterized protein n=1 Tax=Gimesia algae TaxID=2527971 RepID=A0A517VAV4_9PLAN|nr:hypothetical protein [Gimesia algae]QDT90132.1 hypothetical protein Pan161_17810 [Gimesia algae]
MDARVFLTLIVLGLTVTPVKAELKSDSRQQIDQRAREVLREWSEECLSFTGVRGEIFRIDYDDVFRIQKHSVGTFGYLGPQHSFFRFSPALKTPDPDYLKKTSDGKPYEYKEGYSEEWRWQKSCVRCIDHKEKKYEEFRVIKPLPPESELKWFDSLRYFTYMDTITLILPGVPDQAKFDEFISDSYLQVMRENETHIWIAGKPKNRRHAANFREFKLYLEKNPWRLRAVQYIHPSGNQSTICHFSKVEFNPLEWEEPDLSGYRNLSERPVIVPWPEKEDTSSIQQEAGAQVNWAAVRIGLSILTMIF